ncbi:hypothetical protein DFR24_3885 [Panacagrimonas perspica]|uniref:Uncharacterized protein n=1 Tax=Panacagrimonas perspica TaxID=381431 RepID=A0A4R7NZP8_9GAMM|nr:hypothetical protein [Panacagrimonas perspica]TDU26854.1 hypothetical protein DFR24_3885 [Panacagrimonas perspica]THD03627.1 hypothetical protein B1810_08750 [Panacagrimonas perspica]
MQMRPDLQIKSVIKAMNDVVLPAVDPQNKLAQEQVRLCMGLLGLMAKQLPLQFRFDCDELARLSAYSAELQRIASGGGETGAALAALAEKTADANATLERAKSSPYDIEQAVRSLREATGSLVSGVFRDGDSAVQDRVQRATLAMSKEQLLRDRAWVITQGWEPDPKSVPPIEQLLGISAS